MPFPARIACARISTLLLLLGLLYRCEAQNTISVRKPDSAEVYLEVDEQPEYPYGVNPELYLRQQRYECSEDGTVIVEVTISEQGFAINSRISKSLAQDCDAEALKIVNSLGQWKPGILKGKAVPYRYFLPIRFYEARVIGR